VKSLEEARKSYPVLPTTCCGGSPEEVNSVTSLSDVADYAPDT